MKTNTPDFAPSGLSVTAVMQILNVTKSYVYRMIREDELEVIYFLH